MADRQIMYPGAIPRSLDVNMAQRHMVEGLGHLAGLVLGAGSVVEGMTVGPSSPAGLSVLVQPGQVYMDLALDGAPYSTAGSDSHIVKQQGLLRDPLTLTLTPPGGAGTSRIYVVQVSCYVEDREPTTLPYFNATDTSTAWSGPNNAGTPQNTRRAVRAIVSLKAGADAATGAEIAPAPDPGNVALGYVAVRNGATAIQGGDISGNPALRRKMAALPDIATAIAVRITVTRRTFLSSQTYVPPAGLIAVDVEAIAGGGGGGGSQGGSGQGAGGGGGGEGGYARSIFSASVIAGGVAMSIGAPGAGGLAGANNGTTGGNTTFGAFLICNGGAPGAGCATGGTVGSSAAGGTGGAASGGHVNATGAPGMAGLSFAAAGGLGGMGGGTRFGAGGTQSYPSGSGGNVGFGRGAGGSGAASAGTSYAGGPGVGGMIVVTEYCLVVT